ncbi:hypothetical protein F4820DRAFT_985 [Hypoxylon rubiginosum]|uniref:Uncharacterized protein n=1 Tax=Hypoxylon rubiginosum TaxID=110542 RepID=A0ACB9ZKC7_9PEZI|nr:hypothetical protein F4820DRAFT_985 [Hypoxylon rubiginosum]
MMGSNVEIFECANTFLFGGHVVSQTKGSLGKQVQSLLEGPNADWIKGTVTGLQEYWDVLTAKVPEVAGTISGRPALADLDSWLRHGIEPSEISQDESLPNAVVGPLLVAIQLDQYWRYLEIARHSKGLPYHDDLQADLVASQKRQPQQPVVLGFCVGLLGALAVASSANRQEFESYGAAAMRMGMLIGAMIDAREVWDKGLGKGKSVSYATAWRGAKQHEDMTRIVSALYPEAYVSVLFDEARATVTTSERTAPSLVRQLRAASLVVAEIGIEGHIHAPGPDRKRHTKSLVELCRETPGLRFADASNLALPTYDNQGDGRPISSDRGDMTEMVLSSILMLQCDWYGTFSKIVAHKDDARIVSFGLDRCIPPTLQRRLGARQEHFDDIEKTQFNPRNQTNGIVVSIPLAASELPTTNGPNHTTASTLSDPLIHDDSIAVVGMSIKVAGADDLDEFVDMLRKGDSQHQPITRDRLQHDMLHRAKADADPKVKFYANFIRDSDAFDHKFFKRSPRESQAMDPQSRLCLEGAYQAVEQSGYFTETTKSSEARDKLHVGVYLGNCGVDYEHNISCNPPTAFTATGGLKSFIVGRLSHYFGWTGPSVTFDTACSSSTTAIHTACRNLLSGECSAALCGGVNIITNMLWMQNLAAGSFISHTGQCKPFDDAADGYCRAEGMAFVFLKKLSDAVADGNPILATIPSTAVYQNLNCTPLFVPNAPSLSHLFKDVMKAANLKANDISLVEAHGTGTPVGDPAEYESIRLAVGGPVRKKPLPFGSVKGHIGHTEGASGIIALVKVIMMMRHSFIPAQASFEKLNHQIEVRPDDMMEIVTSLRPWSEKRKIVLINNYGACGSNASMLVAQPPASLLHEEPAGIRPSGPSRLPFWVTGFDWRSIHAYSTKLDSWMQRHVGGEEAALPDLSFAMSRQSNRGLPSGLIFSCSSVAELKGKLRQVASSTKENALSAGILPVKAERPVILCFGGQVSTFVGLDRQLYDSVAVLRFRLDECDSAIRSSGLESIYPDIFSREPVKDTVKLQTMLFALQYSCAKTWTDCGLEGKVAAVVGHSFGELTALCVAGVLSVVDAVKLVAGRAKLVRDAWGTDSGAMMAIEADEALIQDLLLETNRASNGSAAIACYNGPRSFTIAGSTKSIDAAVEILAGNTRFSGIKSKHLNVSNAFHSVLVDKIVDGLGQVGKGLTFHKPIIPVEHATEDILTSRLDWTFVPSHMRKPVFFNHAIQRLADKHPNAIFLEAGSSSTITVMAGRALAQRSTPPDAHFQAMSLTSKGAIDALTDATVALWKQGLQVSFWSHHPRQAREYTQLLLPPYQFDKAGRHWLEMKSPADAINEAAEAIIEARGLTLATNGSQTQHRDQEDARKLDLFSFVAYQDKKKKRKPRFQVNTLSDKYNYFFAGHVIAQTAPICPATLESDMAIEALFSLFPEWKAAGMSPVLHDLVNHSPLCANPSRAVYIDFEALDDSQRQWGMKMFSANAAANNDVQTHVEARLHFRAPTDADFLQEFERFERLVPHSRCQALLALGLDDERDDVDVLRGRNVYRAFKDVVDYPELYRGVRTVVGRGNESAGVVHKRHQGRTWLDVPLSDSCSQIGGMWVNLMTELSPGEMYIATGCEVSMRSPKVRTATDGRENGPSVWHVFAQHLRKSDKEYTTDVFVFDAADGKMTDAMLGVQYARVAKESMSKMLTRLTKDESVLRVTTQTLPSPVAGNKSAKHVAAAASAMFSSGNAGSSVVKPPKKKKRGSTENKPSRRKDITEDVRDLVSNVSGIEASEFTLDTEMAELGIDSLMGMELAREVEIVFKCAIDQAEQMEATTLRKFVACVANALERDGVEGAGQNGETPESDDDEFFSSSDEGATWSRPSQNDTDSQISTPNGSESPLLSEKPIDSVLAADSAESKRATASNLTLSRSDILESFGEVKMLTDELMREHRLDTIHKTEIAGSNRLCAALVVEALEQLGMPLRAAAPGQELERVPFLPQHHRLMECVYEFLERDARLVDIDSENGRLTRTHIAVPRKSSDAILQELLETQPSFAVPNRMTLYAGQRLADVLSGVTDGIRVIFGTPKGRELVQAMYCDHTFNYMNYLQMRDVISRLASRIGSVEPGGTLKVLEMGAGTGGTTLVIAPFLATLNIPVEYTFTDLSPSMVANARRTFGKQYPFMKFAVHDIEKAPAEEHRGQHVVLASNAVHATHSLAVSARNIRQALRPDGFLMILEMTEVVPFVDLVFGLLEGWWLFDDGRTHAVVPAEHWERELRGAGFGHVDWTDGSLPENAFQKVIMALASGEPEPEHLPKALPGTTKTTQLDRGDVKARELEAEGFVATYTRGWDTPELNAAQDRKPSTVSSSTAAVVVVTGATGSLGAHLVQQFAEHPGVATVVCVNRPSSRPVDQRQEDAFNNRGIILSPDAHRKLRVLETDTSKPHLGLPTAEYAWLAQNGTHIVHNAWPMSGTRPIKAFEPQFQSLRNLLDLARSMAVRDHPGGSSSSRIGFQLVSSIGVVGYAGEPRVLERRVPMAAVLPGGYTEAKWACERMLDETLHRYPRLFRPMVARPGQIAGSTASGYWNPVEHFAFLVKSAQALGAWPDFDGVLQWLPVDTCARVMAELLRIGGDEQADKACPVYHIDNPVGQPWKAMSPVLAAALGIPPRRIVPFADWVKRVRRSPLSAETENPAARIVDFLEFHFERMSCGGLILDTQEAQRHSEALARQGPVSADVARLYVASWKKTGFLN